MSLRPVMLGTAVSACLLIATTCGGNSDNSGGAPDAGLPLGASCTLNTDCASAVCLPYRGQTVHFCTKPCTGSTQATDCPIPPTTGTCGSNGYCEFN